jgi:hypothetical protein
MSAETKRVVHSEMVEEEESRKVISCEGKKKFSFLGRLFLFFLRKKRASLFKNVGGVIAKAVFKCACPCGKN